jgi:hypothetical protein
MDRISNHPLYKAHNIDSAMSSLWDFYKKRFLTLFLISFAMSLVVQYASTFINIQDLYSVTDPMVILEKMKPLIGPIVLVFIVNLFFNVILQYYIIFSPLDNETSFFEGVIKSLKFVIPYLVIMVLLAFAGSVAIALGILLLVVGVFFSVLYIMTVYLFILPVMMAEGMNIGHTILRTITLAHRKFWTNIGWVAVFLIIMIVLSLILSGVILLPFTGSFIRTIVNPGEASSMVNMVNNPLFIILSALASAFTMPLIPLFSCILYFNGKAREDVSSQNIIADPESTRLRVEDLYAKPYSDDHPDNPDNKI